MGLRVRIHLLIGRVFLVVAAVLAVVSLQAQDCSRPIAGAVSWWPGDGSETDLVGPNPGTLVGGAGFRPGWVGEAFTFDGTDDHVAIPFHSSYDFMGALQFAVAAWVNVADVPSPAPRALVVKSPANGAWDWGLYLTAENKFMAGKNSVDVVTSSTAAVPGVWYHVAFTYQDSLWHLYVNGSREATNSGILITRSTGGLALARRGEATASADYFGGALDEVEVFNRALTPCSVSALADMGRAGQCKGDDDADGIVDTVDNCLRTHNPTQVDEDGDMAGDACDCEPADATVFSIPAEIRRVAADSNKHVLTWCHASLTGGSGSVHDVVRGIIAELPVGSGVSETCMISGLASARTTDTSVPSTGRSRWYLVRGRNSCGRGTYGFQSIHGAPGPERVTTACP